MFSSTQRYRALLYLKGLAFSATSPTLKHYPLFQHYPSSPFSLLRFCTNTSDDSRPFAVSYIIHNFGLSPESASKLCSTYNVRFKTAQNPDSVISFFRSRGFSDSQLRNMIEKAPWLLSCDPCKRVLPKFEFFVSKGASTSDIVDLVSKHPMVLCPNLENQLVPAYDLVYRFLQSDKDIIALLYQSSTLFGYSNLAYNIRVLIENGVTESNIARLLRIRSFGCKVFSTRKMLEVVEELKDLGFHPSKFIFVTALMAKINVPKIMWNKKVDAYKKWGWSDEDILEAFRIYPRCMLASVDKINSVMSFWVNQLGWDALALAKGPSVIMRSMERTIIPRAAVVQLLLKKGLRKKNASLTCPFIVSEKLFLVMFIKCFEDKSCYLLKLYKEKRNVAYIRDKTGMS